MKLKPEELRKGNIIQFDDDGAELVMVDHLFFTGMTWFVQWTLVEGDTSFKNGDSMLQEFQGAKLNPKIISRLGLVLSGDECGDEGAYETGCGPLEKGFTFMWCPNTGEVTEKGLFITNDFNRWNLFVEPRRVRYLHQLQNIYYDLMHKQLKYSIPKVKNNLDIPR